MASDPWPPTLGEVLSLQRGTTYKSALLDRPGPILLGLASIRPDGGFRRVSLRTYGGDSPAKLILGPGDIYVSLKDVTQSGDLLGAVSRVPRDIQAGRLTQDTVKLEFKGATVPPSYIFWLLRTPQYRAYCRARAIGTTNLSLTRDDFLSFPVPELTEHRSALVDLLEALEAKIDLNREASGTAEDLARTVFQSWFVNFDLARANTVGDRPDLPPAITSAFPSGFVDSELGAIPDGWQVRGLDDVATFLNGLALQKYPPDGGGSLPVIKIAQLRKNSVVGADRAGLDVPHDYVVSDGDVLFSWSGSLECTIWTGGRGALNQHLFKVTSTTYPKWFYYLWIHQHLPEFRQIAAGKATTMGHIQRHHLAAAKVVVPDDGALAEGDKFLTPLLERASHSRIESRSLAALRDAVLPRLMWDEFTDLETAQSGAP